MNENTLIENAILAFLHHYPEHDWANDYKLLLTKVRKTKDEQSKTPTVQKRGRPAKRQRKAKASSETSSESKD